MESNFVHVGGYLKKKELMGKTIQFSVKFTDLNLLQKRIYSRMFIAFAYQMTFTCPILIEKEHKNKIIECNSKSIKII